MQACSSLEARLSSVQLELSTTKAQLKVGHLVCVCAFHTLRIRYMLLAETELHALGYQNQIGSIIMMHRVTGLRHIGLHRPTSM
jgi:hypothetical protein